MVKKKVLIAEDEVKTRILLTLYLERNNYKVMEAVDGAEALHVIEKERPDIIILNILTPRLSGTELCKVIRANPKFKEVPILFLSSMHQRELIMNGLASGGNDYLTKPFDPNELLVRVRTLLRKVKDPSEMQKSKALIYEPLTYQEINILKLMERGHTNKEIAATLFLTEGTVKVYSHHIYQKLQVKNRTQAIIKAREVAII